VLKIEFFRIDYLFMTLFTENNALIDFSNERKAIRRNCGLEASFPIQMP